MNRADGSPGDQWSFVDELESLLPQMRAFARSICRDETLADDVVQSACLKAWAAADTFDRNSAMRPWIFRIVRNEYLQHCRRAWRNVDVDSEYLEETLVDHGSAETLSDASRAIEAIYALPAKQRDSIVLVLAAGLTYEEAGEVLGCSPGTVKSRVNRARTLLMGDLTGKQSIERHQQTSNFSGMSELVLYAEDLIAQAA